ncbi:MAG: leucine--tRNA ligase [Candidatus Lloydbacteria bacterium RIFCSPHIGHO2_01_FULL_49_22]|uniref:Leucine--tRNA ligase n=1 Tax=Candidatus Lloydbacteria bacterium RIFCSPHIGHO2_01_FULL_49_22 TaxID=1798658 RepID=A0A1G2CUS5_9BACT|nr:MAG: leucine--tRNA ligase [Candidatus Lloydbacteria bacterium RIFCSPHIGHO2_01_FULL_49_22]OGZ10266.1 MAG: leucine--tRNA ligase [Candidatus Lloydbacteria bacterium RIFCSPHIGHO2_02_FULL_50_18]
MREYDHKKIEEKWRKEWKQSRLYRTEDGGGKPKCYVLDEFPYPSGEGLHTGHTRIYTASDIYARMKRMQGFNVLHPSGWDAFGLPAEQYAIKNKIHPSISVKKNTERYKEQMDRVGLSYDWDREINTSEPEFYRWTQWIFLKLYEKGLAFESFEPINWCPSCQTGLANEDLEAGLCERCGTAIEKKPMRQWILKITDYAERLLNDLNTLDWPESMKDAQRNWIGKSEGALIHFRINNFDGHVMVFTTRPDTLCGATYLVVSPEHALVDALSPLITNMKDVIAYRTFTAQKTEIDRTADGKEKTGVQLLGVTAINPATNEEMPVFIADYVLGHVGVGAIMAVPAHDTRDYDFAKKFDLPIKAVIWNGDTATKEVVAALKAGHTSVAIESVIHAYEDGIKQHGPYMGSGLLINSGEYNGMNSVDVKMRIIADVGGRPKVTYKLRDWVFSRQRYWGDPIPLIHCKKCGVVPVPENMLPVLLPNVTSYAPTDTGESPLAEIAEWVNTVCPKCEGPGKRETNTMPQWAGSSWYYLRFMDPHNTESLVSPEKEKYWAPVDIYVGGAEHVTRHLIYARFWHKFLFDIGVVSTSEPFKRRCGVGLVLGEGGVKMSKRLGNVINPDDVVERFGADTLRIYEMFMGPFGQAIPWSTENLIGARRFVERIWRLQEKRSDVAVEDKATLILRHQTIKKVTADIEDFAFNTAISQLMIYANHLEKLSSINSDTFKEFVVLLAPFAPYVAEEIWHTLGESDSVHKELWPIFDETKTLSEALAIAVQVNGKLRDTFSIARGAGEDEIVALAGRREGVLKWLEGKEIKKVIYVKDKLVNIVLG